jgi:hypothetical protein
MIRAHLIALLFAGAMLCLSWSAARLSARAAWVGLTLALLGALAAHFLTLGVP